MNTLLSLPLLKYSYATHESSNRLIPWRHTSQGLLVIFDSFRAEHPSGVSKSPILMKVVQGSELLENVNLQALAEESHAIKEAAQKTGLELRAEKLPISLLIRCPLLAIRYSRPDGLTRSMQLRFPSDEDFLTAYNIFASLNCHIAIAHPQKPKPTFNESANPTSSRPTTLFPTPRPVTPLVSISNSLPSSDITVPASSPPRTQPVQPMHTSTTFPSQNVLPEPGESQQFRKPPIPVKYANSLDGFSIPSQHSTFFAREVSVGATSIAKELRQTGSNLEVVSQFEVPRPSTAPVLREHESIASLLPPRRELPFSRPSSAPKSSVIQDRPPSSSMFSSSELKSHGCDGVEALQRVNSSADLPPLETPTFAASSSTSSTWPNITRSNSNRNAAMTQHSVSVPEVFGGKRSTDIPDRPNTASSATGKRRKTANLKSSTSTSKPDNNDHFSLITNSNVNAHTIAQKKPVSSSKRPTSEIVAIDDDDHRSHAPAVEDSLIEANSQGNKVDQIEQSSMFDAITDRVRQFIRNTQKFDEHDILVEYAAQLDQDRDCALNDFFAEHLNDDNFLVLCQDVAASWRRVALGLR